MSELALLALYASGVVLTPARLYAAGPRFSPSQQAAAFAMAKALIERANTFTTAHLWNG